MKILKKFAAFFSGMLGLSHLLAAQEEVPEIVIEGLDAQDSSYLEIDFMGNAVEGTGAASGSVALIIIVVVAAVVIAAAVFFYLKKKKQP